MGKLGLFLFYTSFSFFGVGTLKLSSSKEPDKTPYGKNSIRKLTFIIKICSVAHEPRIGLAQIWLKLLAKKLGSARKLF